MGSLTTRGRCLLAGGLAALVCALVLDERDLVRIGVFAAALPLVAIGLTALRSTALTAQHMVVPEQLRPGMPGHVVLQLRNAGPGRTPTLEISEAPIPGLFAGMRFLLAPIKRGVGSRVVYPVNAEHRGRFVLGPPRVRVCDPFDLWESTKSLDVRTELLVVPAVVTLTGMPRSSGARSAASGRAAVGTIGGDPDIGVRQYRNGDDIRTVHWRASARHDELMVRLAEPVSHGGATVVLDSRVAAHRGAGPQSSLETAIVMAASVALHLIDSDHQVRLMSHAGQTIAQGHDIADDVLAGLALLDPDPRPAFSALSIGRTGLVVAVVGSMSVGDAKLLAVSRSRSVNAIAFILDTEHWVGARPGPSPAGPSAAGPSAPGDRAAQTATALGDAGWRVVSIRPGEDLALAWRRACDSDDGYSRGALLRPPASAAGGAGARVAVAGSRRLS